jgi:hypothetical protein
VNQCLETFLRCFVSAYPKNWLQYLPLAQFWYDTSLHSTIDTSPFEAMFGRAPRHFGASVPSSVVSASMQ